MQETLELERINTTKLFYALLFDLFQVIAATNRVDILDPALLRSGRLDRKIEFPNPTEEARARILQIHSRKMNFSSNVSENIDLTLLA